jgi:hypothetical protein
MRVIPMVGLSEKNNQRTQDIQIVMDVIFHIILAEGGNNLLCKYRLDFGVVHSNDG